MSASFNESRMMSPFDALAPRYNELWTATPSGRDQRTAVWREIDSLFRAGDRVLDLGCGTGDDALHLAELGIEVHGIDAAPKMVEIARSRGVNASLMTIEGLASGAGLQPAFSGALSNFGALNCIPDLRPVAAQLAQLIQPAGPVAICLMGRLCLTDWRHAAKRLFGRTKWRGIDVYYPTARRIRAAFAPWFTFERRVAIGRGDHQLHIFRRRLGC
jgi:SAM-dependent methyltransferase